MNTIRHNYHLVMGCDMKTIVAPLHFILRDNLYFVYINQCCEYVYVYDKIRYINNTCIKVGFMGTHKIYTNKKGLYFNYSYWINNHDKKTSRIYISE